MTFDEPSCCLVSSCSFVEMYLFSKVTLCLSTNYIEPLPGRKPFPERLLDVTRLYREGCCGSGGSLGPSESWCCPVGGPACVTLISCRASLHEPGMGFQSVSLFSFFPFNF